MPITARYEAKRVDQREFGEVAFDLMRYFFELHRELGRFFDEVIYKRELRERRPGTIIEFPIDIRFDSFSTTYLLDVMANGCCPFEVKAADGLTNHHRAQLLNYLLLLDLNHGKLVNMRPESVEHEFVNTTLTHKDRTSFRVSDDGWSEARRPDGGLKPLIVELLRDWGTGLEIELYQKAVTHFLSGDERVLQDIDIVVNTRVVGRQTFRLIEPGIAFKLTATDRLVEFESHAHRLLANCNLTEIAWVNIGLHEVRFKTLRAL